MTLSRAFLTLCAARFRPPPDQTVWEWAQDNVDFSLVDDYETPLRGRYDAEYMPWWKEPAESLTDPQVRETWVLKPARAGGTENLLLNPIRYFVAIHPCPILYLTGDQKSAEQAMEKRIKDGLRCAVSTRRKLDAARALEHEIYFADSSIAVKWPKNKTAFKQAGARLLLADEVSVWPSGSVAAFRKRGDTYRDAHIMGISSPDAGTKRSSEDDPIFVEFEAGDQRRWHWKDPGSGEWFIPSMDCLKWDKAAKREDKTWDLRRVRETAHFVCPSGAVIENKDRLDIARAGCWIATNPDANDGIRSYHINAFSMPFKNGDFGQVACAFLDATEKGKKDLRVFVYEYLAEKWTDESDRIEDSTLNVRARYYHRGELPMDSEESVTASLVTDRPEAIPPEDQFRTFYLGRQRLVFVTVDVQKAHQWYAVREWVDPGDSGLVDYGYAAAWEAIEEIADKYKAERVGVDYGYKERRSEVFDYATWSQAWPLLGRANLGLPFLQKRFNPKEGTRRQGDRESILAYEFDSDTYSAHLFNMLSGESPRNWYVYQGIEREYVRQVISTESVDGVWKRRRGFSHDHLWDCEKMQVVLAEIYGLLRLTSLPPIEGRQ